MCIDLYEPEMKKFGLQRGEEIDLNLTVPKSKKITLSEDFAGKGLYDWMIKTVQNLDAEAQGKHIIIQLKLGIYTNEFLRTYIPNNQVLFDKKKGRITIFLVPVDRRTNKIITANATAYEVGGLQP